MPRVTITVPDLVPQPYRFPLDTDRVTLGRGGDSDLVIESGSVSVRHAEMRRVSGGFELRDLGSTNGLKQHGTKKEVVRLADGDSVTVGDVLFEFSLTSEELTELAKETPAPSDQPPIGLPPMAETGPLEEKKSARRAEQEQPVVVVGGNGFAWVLLFLILAVFGFGAGMMVRHQKETGSSLIDGIKQRFSAPAAPVVPAPVTSPSDDANELADPAPTVNETPANSPE